MRYRSFGRTGWQVSEIGYGMWGMGGWTGSDDEESLQALDRAFALGCNFFDTAWVYGQGKSETAARRGATRASAVPRRSSPPRSRRRTCTGRRKAEYPPPTPSRRSHPRIHREEPREPRRRRDRPAAVPRLERRVGGRRGLAARRRRSEAREAGPRVRHQRQPLGAGQRAARARDRPVDSVQVVYNIFDQAPRGRAVSVLPGARHRDHRARAVRRRQPDRHADARLDLARGRLAEPLLHAATTWTTTLARVERLEPLVPRGWTCRSWRCGSSSSTRPSARPFPACAGRRTSSGTSRPATASRCRPGWSRR